MGADVHFSSCHHGKMVAKDKTTFFPDPNDFMIQYVGPDAPNFLL